MGEKSSWSSVAEACPVHTEQLLLKLEDQNVEESLVDFGGFD